MKKYRYFPHVLLLIFSLFGVIWQAQSQTCRINSITPNNNLTFNGDKVDEFRIIEISGEVTTGCDLQSRSSFFTATRVDNTHIKVTLLGRSKSIGYDVDCPLFFGTNVPFVIKFTIKALPLSPGSISSSSVTEIASNTSPGVLTNLTTPSGGTGIYVYQWEESTNGGIPWIEITGEKGASYTCPNLTVPKSFRRRVNSDNELAYSNILAFTIKVPVELSGGSIDCSTTKVAPNSSPGTLTSSSLPQRGNGIYYYQWQRSDNGGQWYDIQGLNVNSESYVCPNLSANTSFRRKVTSGSEFSYSNVLTIQILADNYLLLKASNAENYIIGLTPQIAASTESELLALSLASVRPEIQYFDGLGRPKQTVLVGTSPSGKDVVQPVIYDEIGREQYKFLPYVCNNSTNFGAIRPNPVSANGVSEQKSFYTNATNESQGLVYDAYPYAKTVFEPSPLNRVLQQGAPGADWQPLDGTIPNSGHVQEIGYQTNVVNEVLRFTVLGNTLSGIIGNYAPALLHVTQRTDEDKHISKEYKDKDGQVILKRVVDGTTNLDTYYVYDDFGLLRFVLPPEAIDKINKVRSATPPASEAVTNITASITKNVYENTSYVVSTGCTLTLGNGFYFKATPGTSFSVTNSGQLSQSDQYNLAYQYQYDDRKRMIVKKIPGADEVLMVYDKRDRLVLTQDGEMRKLNQWNFIKYDQLNRPVLTGILTNNSVLDRASMQTRANNSTTYSVSRDQSAIGYTSVSFPNPTTDGSITYLTATYYDTYGFPGCAAGLSVDAITGTTNFTRLNGFVTGSKELVLNTSTFLTTTNYYDDRYRVIQTKRDLYDGNAVSSSNELVSNKYDFVGKVTQSWQVQTFSNNAPTIIEKYFNYDHAGRITTTSMRLSHSGTGFTMSELVYNEIGQLVDKKLYKDATGVFNQSVDFKYNIRGWLTSINDPSNLSGGAGDPRSDFFAESLSYNSPVLGTKLYNGNISEQMWCNSIGKPNISKEAYVYRYDGANRLTQGSYNVLSKGGYVGWFGLSYYAEKGITYDLNGNIKTLTRTDDQGGTAGINGAAYTYNYNGNQLKDINGGAAYGYDKNGNMTADGRTGNAFTYNMLNLPQKVSKGADNINYTYSATGQKLLKNYNGTSNQYYAGNMVYTNAKTLDYIIFEEGVIRKTSTGFSLEYNLKDHLGNTRAVFSATNSIPTLVMQVTDYYPFGQQIYVPSAVSYTSNKYLYNGKELQDDKLAGSSLNMLDYGARFYDAGICRWVAIDPLSEQYRRWSPYNYGVDNPIRFIDPDGNGVTDMIMGFAVGLATNLYSSPASPLIRSVYSPDDAGDYNNALRATDKAVSAVGQVMTAVGTGTTLAGLTTAAGGGALSLSGFGATVGAPAIAVGLTSAAAGTVTADVGANLTLNAEANAKAGYNYGEGDERTAQEPLRKDENGKKVPDPEAEGTNHTQLGTQKGRNGDYKQAREFNEKNQEVKDKDFTDHGRPQNHSNPHDHNYSGTGTGDRQRN